MQNASTLRLLRTLPQAPNRGPAVYHAGAQIPDAHFLVPTPPNPRSAESYLLSRCVFWRGLEPDVVDSLLDDVDSWRGLAEPDMEAQSKPPVKPYRRAAPELDHVKVFIHGHLRGLSAIFNVLSVNTCTLRCSYGFLWAMIRASEV